MLNKYEKEFLESNSKDEIDHKYFLEILEVKPTSPNFNKYYNPNPNSLDERFIIVPDYINKDLILTDVTIRNDFYSHILLSNSRKILEKEKQKVIKNIKTIKYEQLSLF